MQRQAYACRRMRRVFAAKIRQTAAQNICPPPHKKNKEKKGAAACTVQTGAQEAPLAAVRQYVPLEAAELLEVFQWSGTDLECRDKLGRIREELADVLSYCILMADVCGLDLDEIMNEKIAQNQRKYPVEKSRGRAAKYTELL